MESQSSAITFLEDDEREGCRLLQLMLNPEHANRRLHPYYREHIGKFLDAIANNRLLLAKVQTLLQKRHLLISSGALTHPTERDLVTDTRALRFVYRYVSLSTVMYAFVSGINKLASNFSLPESLQGKEMYAVQGFLEEGKESIRSAFGVLKAFGVNSRHMDHILALQVQLDGLKERLTANAFRAFHSGVFLAVDGDAYQRFRYESLSKWTRFFRSIRNRFLGDPILGLTLFYRDEQNQPCSTPPTHSSSGGRLNFPDQFYLWAFDIKIEELLSRQAARGLAEKWGAEWVKQLRASYGTLVDAVCRGTHDKAPLTLTQNLISRTLLKSQLVPHTVLDMTSSKEQAPQNLGVERLVQTVTQALKMLRDQLQLLLRLPEEPLKLPFTTEHARMPPEALLQYLSVHGWLEVIPLDPHLKEIMGLADQPPILVSKTTYHIHQKLSYLLKTFWRGHNS